MAYLMLYGVGWTQRWQIAPGARATVEDEIGRVGREEVGRLAVLDPEDGSPTTLTVAWRHVAAAVVLGSADPGVDEAASAGAYR